MESKMCKTISLLLLFSFVCAYKCEIINSNVERKVNIKSQLVKIQNIVTIKNLYPHSVNKFIYSIDPDVHDFYIKFRNQNEIELTYKEIDRMNYEVIIDQPLLPNSTYVYKTEIVYVHKIMPLLQKITLKCNQIVSYKGNLLYYSPYSTKNLKTTYLIQIDGEFLTSHVPYEFQNTSMSYYNDTLSPFSFERFTIEFKNNRPFLVAENVERVIDVSHFGKISVKDTVTIKNEGGELVGPYEPTKTELQMAASDWWYMHLPAEAENIKYYDVIGNNSKSELKYFKHYTTFKFKPRYPLLNGWKTAYTVKYSVPTHRYLYYDTNNRFLLKMRIIDHILTNIIIRNVSTKVLLPEAAEIMTVSVPYGFVRLEDEKHYTELSTFGRPTLSFAGSTILENHIALFTVEYLFAVHYLIRAPLMIIFYLETMFVFYIIVSRYKLYYC